MKKMSLGYRIVEEISRPEQELIEKLRHYSSAELCDGSAVYNAMDYRIKPLVTTRKIVGPAVTVRLTLGDSLMVTRALSLAKPGDVLVIDGRGSENNALWGDNRSLSAILLGLEGVVLDGAFRDIEENEALGFPIYARAITCGSSTKNSHGEVNVPVSCGGVTVNPGDIIVGDRNGVCVIPPAHAEEIIAGAQRKVDSLNQLKEDMRNKGVIIPQHFAAQMDTLGY